MGQYALNVSSITECIRDVAIDVVCDDPLLESACGFTME